MKKTNIDWQQRYILLDTMLIDIVTKVHHGKDVEKVRSEVREIIADYQTKYPVLHPHFQDKELVIKNKIDDLDISIRCFQSLRHYNIKYLEELSKYRPDQLLKFSMKSIEEIEFYMKKYNISWNSGIPLELSRCYDNIESLKKLLPQLNSEQRMEVFNKFHKMISEKYCIHCGVDNPRCQCENDE